MKVGLTLAALLSFCAPAYAANSQFDCAHTEESTALPTIEGKDGYFFRVFADLRMQHPMTDFTVDHLGLLAEALAERGTTLIYVPIPTKSQSMPDKLPETAAEYGFDFGIATSVYKDIVTRMEARGVATPDIQDALLSAEPDKPPFFRADFHWTSDGARLGAQKIAERMKETPAYAGMTPEVFETTELKPETAFSGMRRVVQNFCKTSLPEVETIAYRTDKVETEGGGGLDIFASGADDTIPVVLVGTSFSDSAINNFAGFISQYSGLDVVNYAITGGNQFGSIISYLTSDEFRETPPAFLIWENPIYNNLAQYGDGPLMELIAAAGGTCTQPLPATPASDKVLVADLSGIKLGAGDIVLADAGQMGSRSARFTFQSDSGRERIATIARGDRLRATGRYYQPLRHVRLDGLSQLSVEFDSPASESASLTICKSPKEDAS
jgi:alginate biosynthesis protein AlgX